MAYRFQFQVIWDNWGLFLQGLLNTIQFSALAILLGLGLGTVGALCRTSNNQVLGGIATTYVELIRNTPFLIQLLFIFFGISSLGPRITSDRAALIALSINFGAYATEIIRAGINGIECGQLEAGRSLGLSHLQVFRHVMLKPAIANSYPALTSQMVLLMLLSSVISQISVEELTYVGNFLRSRTFRDFEIYIAIAIIYICLTLVFKLIAQLLYGQLFKFTRYT